MSNFRLRRYLGAHISVKCLCVATNRSNRSMSNEKKNLPWIASPKLTASLHLKMDGWRNTIRLPLGWFKHPIFQVLLLLVSGRVWPCVFQWPCGPTCVERHCRPKNSIITCCFHSIFGNGIFFSSAENLGTTLPENLQPCAPESEEIPNLGFRIMKHRFQPLVFGGVVQIYEFRGDLKNHLSLRDIPSAMFRVRKS